MKRIELRNLRSALDKLTFAEFSDAISVTLLDNLTTIIPVDDEFSKIIEIAQKAFFTEEYNEASKKFAEVNNQYIAAQAEEKKALSSQLIEADKALKESCKDWFEKYNQFIVSKGNEDVKVVLKKIANKEKFQSQLLAFAKKKDINASMLMVFNVLLAEKAPQSSLDERAVHEEIENFKIGKNES